MNELHVVVIVSQVPEFVCKQLRKTVIPEFVDIYTRKQDKNTKEENHFLRCIKHYKHVRTQRS